MKKTITTNVRIPSDWLKISLNDIIITVTAHINESGDSVDVKVKEIIFPGWHSFNIDPKHQFAVYELVEQKCMDAYTFKMESDYDHSYYSDYVL